MQTNDPDRWRAGLRRPLDQRIAPAPGELVHYVGLVNRAAGNDVAPSATAACAALRNDVRAAMAGLPALLQSRLERPLLGVYLARDLGCSAITEVVRWHDETLGAAVLLDAGVLARRTANAWASWKEGGPFRHAGGNAVAVTIAAPDDDLRSSAIRYLLLHEFGHVLSADAKFLPNWWIDPRDLLPAGNYRYLDFSWRVDDDRRMVPSAANEFAGRDRLAYYGVAQLDGAQVPAIYAALAQTNFATLYGATNAYDDFAECFALYVHTVLMRRPYRVERSGAALSDAAAVAARCAEKYAFVAGLLGTVASAAARS